MRELNNVDVKQVSGAGEGYSLYVNTQIPLSFLPVIADQIEKFDGESFDLNQFMQAINDAGLDANQIKFDISFSISEYSDSHC